MFSHRFIKVTLFCEKHIEIFSKIILTYHQIAPKNVFELLCYINLVHIEAVRGLYHGALLLHVPFHVKDIFRVGVGSVPVIRVLCQVVLLR